nr:hypothetical protein [uncultured Oscillibacter sp.]
MKQLYGFWLACRIEYHWRYILKYRKRGKGMIESGAALSSSELVTLSQKITRHGMVALRLQDEYENKVLS